MKKLIFTVSFFICFSLHGYMSFAQNKVSTHISEDVAKIENGRFTIVFNLIDGTYSGINRSDNTTVFKNAWFRIGQSGWKEPAYEYKSDQPVNVQDGTGAGKKLRVWYFPIDSYDPARFLDITVYEDKPFFSIGWGVKNNLATIIRVRSAEVLLNGILFENQKISDPKVLRGGAGAEPNFVESTWQIEAHNSAMLTYKDILSDNRRRTIVAGGYKYKEFMRTVEFHEKGKSRRLSNGGNPYPDKHSFITLTVHDPQGKYVDSGETWTSDDTYFVDIVSDDPFESLETYGKELALKNNASPNTYNFPTLCGWMVSTKSLGEGKNINNSAGLVNQMIIAGETGILNYCPVAVRLEPDYYCYNNDGNTQQGWWDDEHWAKYGSLVKPYETFAKFSKAVHDHGGKVFTYFQSSMPGNDFALKHPEWMLNDDISLIYEDHPHHIPFIRYDYTNPGFQNYLLKMWKRLHNDGVVGIKFDYPETSWAWNGGFDDKSYTTVSAYRKLFQLCREGLGKDAFIHERIIGNKVHENVPRTDCTAGIVDLQRVWNDASHFEPEMSSRIGLRWYKQGKVYRYYPDGKSFYYHGKALSQKDRRTFLTLVGLLSGRIEMGTSFGSMTPEMIYDLTRLFPVLPNGNSFRPVDMLLNKKHPEIYVYAVNDNWKQVILINNDSEKELKEPEVRKTLYAPASGDQANTGSLGLDRNSSYHIFDFWNQKPLGILKGSDIFSADLLPGEALVYSVKEVEDHPQIVGTNRHVMCGMMELSNVGWNSGKKTLKFAAQLIKGETMKITVVVPQDAIYIPKGISCNNAEASYEENEGYLTVSVYADKNTESIIELNFE